MNLYPVFEKYSIDSPDDQVLEVSIEDVLGFTITCPSGNAHPLIIKTSVNGADIMKIEPGLNSVFTNQGSNLTWKVDFYCHFGFSENDKSQLNTGEFILSKSTLINS